MIAIFGVGGVNYLFQTLTGEYFGTWLLNSIQLPLVKWGQGFGTVLLVTFSAGGVAVSPRVGCGSGFLSGSCRVYLYSLFPKLSTGKRVEKTEL